MFFYLKCKFLGGPLDIECFLIEMVAFGGADEHDG